MYSYLTSCIQASLRDDIIFKKSACERKISMQQEHLQVKLESFNLVKKIKKTN
jgi:hypothetical protein